MDFNFNYDITSIEGSLIPSIKTAVGATPVFGSRRPTNLGADVASFVVVKSVTEVVDQTAFGKNICRVEVFVKGRGGVKDASTMSSIIRKIFSALPVVDKNYTFSYMSNIPLGMDATGYDVEAVNINVLIK